MKERLDTVRVIVQIGQKRIGLDDVDGFALRQIAPFIFTVQVVANGDRAGATVFEGGNQVGADETGAAGYDDHEMALIVRESQAVGPL